MPTSVLVIDAFAPELAAELAHLPGLDFRYRPEIRPEAVADHLAGVEVLVLRSKCPVDGPLLDHAPDLRLIIRGGVGTDHIDPGPLTARGIQMVSTPGVNRDAVGEHAVGMLLGLLHRIPRADRQVRQRQWKRAENRGHELGQLTVGILGYGHTGSAVAAKLQGFGCRILAHDKYKSGFGQGAVEEVDLPTLLGELDVLTLHVPLTAETRGLVDRAFLDRLARPIWLMNMARGPIVRTADLPAALEAGQIRGAALDVLENERLDTHTPEEAATFAALIARDDLLLTPHIAGWSWASERNMARAVANHIRTYLAG